MAKFHYVQRARKQVSAAASLTDPTSTQTFVASRTLSDTYVRSVWSPWLRTVIDPSVSPPIDEWWIDASVSFTARFSSDGSTGAGTSEDEPTVVGITELYPTAVRDSPLNGLSYVTWAPRTGPSIFHTSRKGDGVNFPRVIAAMWPADFHAVFINSGGLSSVKHAFGWHGVVVWASDHP